MAINRQEIIDSIYYGFGNLPEMVPSEYNPEEAKKLLDEMGLDKKDSNGFRLGPDGKVFEIHFEVAAHAPDIVPVTELVVQMWNEIGIKTSMKTIDATLWSTRNNANELQATNIWNIESSWRTGGWLDFMPSNEGKLWEVWNNTKGQEGEEPPEDVKRLYELGGLIMTVYPGTPEDQQYFDEIYKIHYDGIYQMVIAEDVKCPVIVRKGMGNVPIKGDKHAATISGEQMFYRK